VMQSIHNLAQHWSIISMEEFMAQVAWPRVQPSPVGEGEALIAQEPQPEPEVTPEATPEETPEVTLAAMPTEDAD